MVCQHGFRAGEHHAVGANVQVVLNISLSNMYMVARYQALMWCCCPLHRHFVSSEWPGGTEPLPLPLLSPEDGSYLVPSVGGRLPCCFFSTERGQADRSLVLLRAGDRQQDCREWKETGISVLLEPLSAAAFHHNVWVPTMSRSQEPPPARVPFTV